MSETSIRLRDVLARYRLVFVLAFVLLALAGGWLAYGAYVDPGETTEQRLVSSVTTSGEFSHGAIVEEENTLYPVGTEFTNEPLYYRSLSPEVTGEFVGGYDGADGEDVEGTLDVRLVYRSLDDDAIYWQESAELGSASASDLQPGEELAVAFAINVTEVTDRIDEIESDLDASPGDTELFLEVEHALVGTFDGTEREVEESHRIDLEIDGSTHGFDDERYYGDRHEEYEEVVVPQEPPSTNAIGGPLLLVLGLVGAGTLAIVSPSRYEITPEERAWLEYRSDLEEYGELTTAVELPPETIDRQAVEIQRLGDLCRLGIDLETAIFETTDRVGSDRIQYVVIHDDFRYVYDPPNRPADLAGVFEMLVPGRRDRSSSDSDTVGDARSTEARSMNEGSVDTRSTDEGSTDARATESESMEPSLFEDEHPDSRDEGQSLLKYDEEQADVESGDGDRPMDGE